MDPFARDGRIHPAWWTLILITVVSAFCLVTFGMFNSWFTPTIPITLTSERSGLVMETGAKVKLRGVEVGRVVAVSSEREHGTALLQLAISSTQIAHIPSNVTAQIRATTVFGAKYVDLVYPDHPSPQRLNAGATIKSRNVTTEVNTVFQNLTDVLRQLDPEKVNSVLSALAEGVRDKGNVLGQAISDANQFLIEVNPRSDTVRRDWRALAGFSDTYHAAADHILNILDAATTTSLTITDQAKDLDAVLFGLIGLSHSGTQLLGANRDHLIQAVKVLEPTTRLLEKYNPELTCTLIGGKNVLDFGFQDIAGGANKKSVILDVALLLGDDPYKYPENLPVIGARGGPDGTPGCGSLPDVAKAWPHRYLVTNTGWGTGLDMRPNPGIGFPGYADYFPTTRGQPRPPSLRNQGGPAPGPIAYPGGPPYGAKLYAPDGTPLWPGLPPAPPPGREREPGPPPPGSEPFTPAVPATVLPTPLPVPPR